MAFPLNLDGPKPALEQPWEGLCEGLPLTLRHIAGHSTPPDLEGGGEGVAPPPLESPHLGSAIVTEVKSAREIAARQAVRAVRVRYV